MVALLRDYAWQERVPPTCGGQLDREEAYAATTRLLQQHDCCNNTMKMNYWNLIQS
jgi:hypothetical protein